MYCPRHCLTQAKPYPAATTIFRDIRWADFVATMGLSVNRRRMKIVAVDAKSGQALVREISEWKDIMTIQ